MKAALIIGLGSIGRRHREVLGSLHPQAEIHAVSGHAEPAPGIFRDLAAIPDPRAYDYYVIASETARHRADLEWLCSHVEGKMILVEKPLFSQDEAFDPRGNRVFVGYNLRFHPALRALRDALSGQKVLSINVNTGQYLPDWRPDADYRTSYSADGRRGGGVLLDLSHEIDYVQWLCGPFGEVKAIVDKISDLEIRSEDFMTLVGRSERGAIATISLDYLSRKPQRRIAVQAEGMTAVADLVEGSLGLYRDGPDGGRLVRESREPVERNLTYLEMHRSLTTGDGDGACSLEEGVSVLKTVSMIRNSSRMDWNG